MDELCAPPFMATAHSDDGAIMAIAHRHHLTYGVQFHLESVLTEQGQVLLMNFLRLGETFLSGASSTPWKLVE